MLILSFSQSVLPSSITHSLLLSKGPSTDLKCHWTDMNALHYAVFFDCAQVVELLIEHNPGGNSII